MIRKRIIISGVAGALIGLLTEVLLNAAVPHAVTRVRTGPVAWSDAATQRYYLYYVLMPAMLSLVAGGAVAIVALHLVPAAVKFRHRVLGGLAGLVGAFPPMLLFFISWMDNSQAPKILLRLLVASVVAGVALAALFTGAAYGIRGRPTHVGIGWAILGGLVGGFIGMILLAPVAIALWW